MTPETEKILSTEYSEKFDELRKKQMTTSFYKYGYLRDNATTGAVDYVKSMEIRLQKYKDTGNTEFLGDVANCAMIEFMYPQHPRAHYRPTDSRESPGLHGMSLKEIADFKAENGGT